MYSTPSKLSQGVRDPPTHLIVTQAGSSSDEDFEAKLPVSGLMEGDRSDLDAESDDSGTVERLPRLNLGANASEMAVAMQTQIVNAFHKVLSVLRQYVSFTIIFMRGCLKTKSYIVFIH